MGVPDSDRQTVHFVPVSSGYEHHVRRLSDDRDVIERVVVLAAAEYERSRYVAKATEILDNLSIDVDERVVRTGRFDELVARAYDDILEELQRGYDVAVNASSAPSGLGLGYATAASFIAAEASQAEGRGGLTDVSRDDVSVYYTEPEEYPIDTVLEVASQAPHLLRHLETAREDAEELRSEVKSDRQTAGAILSILDDDADEEPWSDFLASLELILQEELLEAVEEVFEGIDQVRNGVDTLVSDEYSDMLDVLESFAGDQDSETEISVFRGIKKFSDRPDSTGDEVSVVDLFEYIEYRLERVDSVLENVEAEYEASQRDLSMSADEMEQRIAAVEEDGLAQGCRTFDGDPYVELPGPISFPLRPLQRLELDELAANGHADSITGLTVRVLRRLFEMGVEYDLNVPDHPDAEAILTDDLDEKPPLLSEKLLPRYKNRVRNDVDGLVQAGFVIKKSERFRRSVSVELTPAGLGYTSVRDDGIEFDVLEEECRTVAGEAWLHLTISEG